MGLSTLDVFSYDAALCIKSAQAQRSRRHCLLVQQFSSQVAMLF